MILYCLLIFTLREYCCSVIGRERAERKRVGGDGLGWELVFAPQEYETFFMFTVI